MNKIMWEVDAEGSIVETQNNHQELELTNLTNNTIDTNQSRNEDGQLSERPLNSDASSHSLNEPTNRNNVNYKRATEFMRTPCGHRYHPHCLRKWMEIRLECPFCR